MPSKSLNLVVSTLFGVIVFLSKIAFPTPIDKMFIVVQGLMLALGSLIIGNFGGTYVGFIGGLLTAVLREGFGAFSLIFAIFYGASTDVFLKILNVKKAEKVKRVNTIIALTLSTAITGVLSMYSTTTLGLLPFNSTLYAIIILAALLNGVLAGYLATIIWNRYLIFYFKPG
jgi:uncharacterized membrane protein